MKKVWIVPMLALALAATSTTAQAEKITPSLKYVTKEVKVDNFYAISTSRAIDVVYDQKSSGKPKVEIYASDNLIDYIEVEVKKGKLNIGLDLNQLTTSFTKAHRMEVRVSAPAVNELSATTDAVIMLKGDLEAEGRIKISANTSGAVYGDEVDCMQLDISTNTSGIVELKDVDCDQIAAQANTSGTVRLVGECDNATLSANTGAEISAKELKAKSVKARANTGGEISCYATDLLDSKSAVGGKIECKGSPKEIKN